MTDQDAIDQLEAIMRAAAPEDGVMVLLQYIFVKVAEIDGSVQALTPVIGAIAGRVGVSGAEIRRLTEVDQERK